MGQSPGEDRYGAARQSPAPPCLQASWATRWKPAAPPQQTMDSGRLEPSGEAVRFRSGGVAQRERWLRRAEAAVLLSPWRAASPGRCCRIWLEAVVSRVVEGLGERAESSWKQQRMDGGAKAKLRAPSVRSGSSGLSFGLDARYGLCGPQN